MGIDYLLFVLHLNGLFYDILIDDDNSFIISFY